MPPALAECSAQTQSRTSVPVQHSASSRSPPGFDDGDRLERDDFSSNRHPALAFWWSMIFFRKPVPTFRDHALNAGAGKSPMPGADPSPRKFGEQERFMLLLIAPAALLLLLFQVTPIVIGANASFRDWALYNPKKTWVGFAHYGYVITDPAFLQVALPNTFLFMAASVSGALVLGLALATLLD